MLFSFQNLAFLTIAILLLAALFYIKIMSNKLKSRDIILTDVRLLLTKTANSNKTKINLDDLTHLWNLIRESPDYYMLESTQRDRLHEIYKEINSILKYSFLTNEISDLSSMDVWNLWKKINTKASFQLKPSDLHLFLIIQSKFKCLIKNKQNTDKPENINH